MMVGIVELAKEKYQLLSGGLFLLQNYPVVFDSKLQEDKVPLMQAFVSNSDFI